MPTSSLRYERAASAVTLLSTSLNSLANGALAVSSDQDNATDGYEFGTFVGALQLASTPTGSPALVGWLLGEVDGTLEDGSDASVAPARVPDLVFPLRLTNGAQRVRARARLPEGTYRLLIRNDAGVALTASGHTVQVRRFGRKITS